jgi:hypothetical protein
MSIVKKVVKFVEETEKTKQKKMQRSKERNTKYAEPDTKVIEEPPQHETQKEFEESFALYKRTCNPKDPLYQSTVITERRSLFKPIKEEIEIEIMQPSVHYKGEGEGWESDCDGWFD